METVSHQQLSPPSPLPLGHMSEMSSADSSQFLKMEDLHTRTTTAPPSPPPSTATPNTQSSPPPVVVQSKPAKKRKSWGQELPEPKTTLPPRKRAKTDDEKEQRRIERIKRNRAAAHNSRERKRQETETLAVALARANAELEAYRNLHGPLPAHIVLPEVHLCTDGFDAPSATTPAPSLVESHGSIHDPPSPESPADHIFHSHSTTPQIKRESLESSFPLHIPPAFDNLDAKPFLLSQLDPTQHSAAMLCDLQCRSSPASSSNSHAHGTTATSAPATFWWTQLFLTLMRMQFQTCYRTLLVALSTVLSPSRMARLMQASTLRSTSPLTTSSTTLRRLSRSTPRRLALYHAATGLGAPRARHAPSLDDRLCRTSRIERASEDARQELQSHHSPLALSEHGSGPEDHVMGDEGDENHGVGRRGSSSHHLN